MVKTQRKLEDLNVIDLQKLYYLNRLKDMRDKDKVIPSNLYEREDLFQDIDGKITYNPVVQPVAIMDPNQGHIRRNIQDIYNVDCQGYQEVAGVGTGIEHYFGPGETANIDTDMIVALYNVSVYHNDAVGRSLNITLDSDNTGTTTKNRIMVGVIIPNATHTQVLPYDEVTGITRLSAPLILTEDCLCHFVLSALANTKTCDIYCHWGIIGYA